MSDPFDALIGPLLSREGGYTNTLHDGSGETNFGITSATARANGYAGDMAKMSRDDATAIYRIAYWQRAGWALVASESPAIAGELFDCGVNMGITTAAVFLQRCLAVFNHRGRDYPDITVDGNIGPGTLSAMRSYLATHGSKAEAVLLLAIRCLRGARYVTLAEANQQDEDYVFGWLENRVAM